MIEVKLHDLGEGLTEAKIVRYLVAPGESIEKDEPVVEVETDKVTAELPAPASGIIERIIVQEGDMIQVGQTLLVIRSAEHNVDHRPSPTQSDESSRDYSKQPLNAVVKDDVKDTVDDTIINTNEIKLLNDEFGYHALPDDISLSEQKVGIRVLASPYTRRLAREKGIDLSSIKGSGPNGRITLKDVERFEVRMTSEASSETHSEREAHSKIETHTERFDQSHTSLGHSTHSFDSRPSSSNQPRFTVESQIIPFRGRRRIIAQRMVQSLYSIPHVSHFAEFPIDHLLEIQKSLRLKGHAMSLTVFILKAISLALKKHPIFNARLHEEKEEIELLPTHHLGVAVDTPEGLIVPVIRHVERLTLPEIDQLLRELIEKARRGQLTISDVQGGTFTISNVGPLGESYGATPIINPPEVAILAFHASRKRPIVDENDQIVIRTLLPISMSFDHRVADGADAVRFTETLGTYLSEPEWMLLDLT